MLCDNRLRLILLALPKAEADPRVQFWWQFMFNSKFCLAPPLQFK